MFVGLWTEYQTKQQLANMKWLAQKSCDDLSSSPLNKSIIIKTQNKESQRHIRYQEKIVGFKHLLFYK